MLQLLTGAVAGEALGAAFAAKEHRTLVENGKTGDQGAAGTACGSFGGDFVEEPQVYRIIPSS